MLSKNSVISASENFFFTAKPLQKSKIRAVTKNPHASGQRAPPRGWRFAILTNGLRPSKVSDSYIRVVSYRGSDHPSQIVNLAISGKTIYMVFGGWLDGPSQASVE